MNDPTRRAIRSFVQVSLVQGLMLLWNAFAAHPLTTDQTTAITVVATPIVVLIQNALEDSAGFPALLKSPASSGQNPVPE